MGPYIAAAYWGPRRESVVDCACRASKFFASIYDTSEYLRGWRQQGKRLSVALETISVGVSTIEELVDLLMKGRNRKDVGGEAIDDLGYRISVWNGGDAKTASSLMIKCGLYSTVEGLSNAVVLKLPSRFDAQSNNQIRQLAVSFASAWDPDWVSIASHSARDEHGGLGPFLDRALYLKTPMQLTFDAPNLAQWEQLESSILFLSK